MEEGERWACPVVRPRPPEQPRRRRNSVPSGLGHTKASRADETPALPGDAGASRDRPSQSGVPPTRAAVVASSSRAGSAKDCSGTESEPDYEEIRPGHRQRGRPSRALSKSFSSGDFQAVERSDSKHGLVHPPRRSVSDDCSWGHGFRNDTDCSASPPSPNAWHQQPTRTPMQQVDEGSLSGSLADRRRGTVLLKQRGFRPPPAPGVTGDGAVLNSSQPAPRAFAAGDQSGQLQGSRDEFPGRRASLHGSAPRRTRGPGTAGETVTPTPPLGANPRTTNPRHRRISTSLLPTIPSAPPTPSTANHHQASMSTPAPARHDAGGIRLPGSTGGEQTTRSLPEEEMATSLSDMNTVHDLQLLTRKKKVSGNFSQEYRLALGDLKTGPAHQGDGKRLLSKRWSALQSSVVATKSSEAALARGGDSLLTSSGSTTDLSRDQGRTDARDDADGIGAPKPPGRGWAIARANLKTIADMAPKDSIDSKPLTFRNIADLVKAKEFRLMMKRRTSFIENGRFQFDEAKQDLYRRYGRLHPKGPPAGSAAATDGHHGGKKSEGPSKAGHRRKLLGLAGSV